MPETTPYHIPALLPQTIEALQIRPEGIYVDATFGGGGHSRAIIEKLDAGEGGRLLGFDQDRDAIDNAFDDPRLTLVYSNFRYLRNFLHFHHIEDGEVDGILADLGVSFHHFDTTERGFSFRTDAPLDMRMNQKAKVTAATVVNEYSQEQLEDILKLYGEVRQARAMAKAIVKARSEKEILTTGELLKVVSPLINPKQEKKELAQVFQALRIEVNGEIQVLEKFLLQALKALRPGGRLAILTYHSLEDRLVKNFMKTGNLQGKVETDFYGRALAPMKLVNSKPIVAEQEEVEHNPRSRSAKLRVAEKL